jgi:hypothetical protein
MKARLADNTPAEFGNMIAAEIDNWARRVKLTGAKAK